MTEMIRLGPGQPPPAGPAIPAGQIPVLVATAARAPSVQNTQPWLFRADHRALEMRADRERGLPGLDPAGRELLISCGAALFGLRLAIRRLGYVPAVSLLPHPGQPDLLARVYLGARAPMTSREWQLLAAVPHRHTHRGAFTPGPLPAGLLAGLQHDALSEGASLVLVEDPGAYQRLAALVTAAGRWQHADAEAWAEVQRWARPPGSSARDGIPAHAYPAGTGPGSRPQRPLAARLAGRDFDGGRGWGMAAGGDDPPAATAILATPGDGPRDWLRAGQALQRLLVHAASRWVFASLTSEPLESAPIRAMVRGALRLSDAPQLVLQLGRADTSPVTARRPVGDVLSLA